LSNRALNQLSYVTPAYQPRALTRDLKLVVGVTYDSSLDFVVFSSPVEVTGGRTGAPFRDRAPGHRNRPTPIGSRDGESCSPSTGEQNARIEDGSTRGRSLGTEDRPVDPTVDPRRVTSGFPIVAGEPRIF